MPAAVEYYSHNDAWYERECPTIEEAYRIISTHKKITSNKIPSWICRRFIIETHNKYGGLGSWRGFYTFQVSDIVELSVNYYNKVYKKKRAMSIFKKSTIFRNWINDILYRYVDEGNDEGLKMGLRVNFHRDSFNRLSRK